MQAHRLREQQRHQHVAIQRLDDRVDRHQIDELVTPTPLEQRDQGDRHGDHHGADIRHHHRQSHQQRQQRRIVEPQGDKGDVGRHATNQDLDAFATNVIGDLPVHFLGHPGHQRPLAWQIAADPARDQFTVLEEEKHQDRHQYQVDHDAHQQRQTGERKGQRPLTKFANLTTHGLNRPQHLLVRHQVRITFRQQQQQ
ncbi:hypothetical protein D3C78_926420 [compost metagenome]